MPRRFRMMIQPVLPSRSAAVQNQSDGGSSMPMVRNDRSSGLGEHFLSRCLLAAAILSLVSPASGQQSYVPRYDVYGGYAFLNSPHVSLFENGFATQIGFRPRRWVSIGFDYT